MIGLMTTFLKFASLLIFQRRTQPFASNFRFIILTAIILSACNKSVQTQAVNETAPTGTLIFQGTLSGANGKTCSGSSKIYQSTSNAGVFYSRLESVTIESDGSTVDLVNTINGSDIKISELSALTGSKNYTYNPGVGAYTFTSTKVKRRSDGQVFCEALLSAVP